MFSNASRFPKVVLEVVLVLLAVLRELLTASRRKKVLTHVFKASRFLKVVLVLLAVLRELLEAPICEAQDKQIDFGKLQTLVPVQRSSKQRFVSDSKNAHASEHNRSRGCPFTR